MATITIEVPDELAEQLSRDSRQLAELLLRSLRQPPISLEVYRYILEFIAGAPSPEQIAAFEPTPEMQQRLRTLVARERANETSLLEKMELDEYVRIEHIIVMLKAGNLRHLKVKENNA
ncbi:MAG TPA: hypothetical protein PLD20_01165 [Blastocatellia bacterium]|nr:hypothetical protein [Blastocatellia bacterium]HMV86594.1 hypothetical protein [Blastocatellia bacterium]HMX24334.1 hypothetical protein [Blastocatellia bacterium]HMY70709.1 hypothetical protein [Blastocatellia bacterium]HMZ16545.1 hypothetical protein [Blastocatellia bacterium]